jgi:hypothetical protein
MKKIFITLSLTFGLLMGGCTSNIKPEIKGSYQSDREGIGYVVQIAFQPDDNSYVEYIDNREVDRGTYEKAENNVYKIKSDKQNFEITLNSKDSFELIIDKLNNGKPIKLKKIDDTPTYFKSKFDDVEKYKALLNKN